MPTRLERFLAGEGPIRFPDDVSRLKREIPELAEVSAITVQELYSTWSEDHFCAGWLIMNAEIVEEFRVWLLEEVEEEPLIGSRA